MIVCHLQLYLKYTTNLILIRMLAEIAIEVEVSFIACLVYNRLA